MADLALVGRSPAGSSVHHILTQIRQRQTLAAADHLLVRPRRGDLATVMRDLARELPGFLGKHPSLERDVFTTLIRIGLNLVGQDVKVAGIPRRAAERALSILRKGVVALEQSWMTSANNAVKKYLAGMASVNSGDSLPGYMAERIQQILAGELTPSGLINAFSTAARETVYWKMAEGRFCKFGNDYARGLEILRHLGFSQVSTNPVLAAKAFDEDTNLVEKLREGIHKNATWKQSPKEYAHDMVMAGTLLALWPNLEVFRPLALLTKNRDYMISFQLNPNVADDAKASLEDAKRAYKLAHRHLTAYDRCLGIANPGKLRPNLVLKVAGSSEAAREVTRELNFMGIGTNNTVTFTVAQEIQLIMDAVEGKCKALRSGKPVTRTYETNMGGRFVSHLRELEASRIFVDIARRTSDENAASLLTRLAGRLGIPKQEIERMQRTSDIAKKAEIVCAFKYLKSLTHDTFLEAVSDGGLSRLDVEQLEVDLRRAGTLVSRRVYSVFYERQNHKKWVAWLQKKYKVRPTDAIAALDSMDVLPASKRIPEDTLDTLGTPNMCNTEFPNHARAVQLFSEKEGFDLNSYRNAVLQPPDPELLKRLMRIEDFVRGYESTKAISAQLMEVGVLFRFEDLGLRGVREDEWRNFGAVMKTMNEFREAYEKFLGRCVDLATAPIP